MANSTLAVLESALRTRKLDRTLTTALPPLERSDPAAFLPFDVGALDTVLRGGLPRGQVSDLAGAQSSGRTTLLLQLIAAVTRRGEIAALIDTNDRLDVAAASAAGIDLDRLLWIRGESGTNERVVDRAVKALNLVLQAGGFLVVLFALTRTLWVNAVLLFGAGSCMVMVFAMLSSLVQLNAPNEMRGRVMSIYMVAFRGGMPLGSLVAGWLATLTTAPAVLMTNGVLLMAVAAWFLLKSHGVREL